MRKYVILLIILLIKSPVSAYTQGGDPVKKIVREMAKTNVFELQVSGTNTTGNQKVRFQQLLENSDTLELASLITNHKNAVVRLYAFQAMVLRQKIIPRNIIDRIMNDKSLVNVIYVNETRQKKLNEIASGFLY